MIYIDLQYIYQNPQKINYRQRLNQYISELSKDLCVLSFLGDNYVEKCWISGRSPRWFFISAPTLSAARGKVGMINTWDPPDGIPQGFNDCELLLTGPIGPLGFNIFNML